MTKNLKATLPTADTDTAKNYSGEKELVNSLALVAATRTGLEEVISARFYMGRSNSASVVYASIWVRGKNRWISGTGSAGGYGYHKESAALDSAIRSAGIKLSSPINGAGDGAMREALNAIAKACGYAGRTIIV